MIFSLVLMVAGFLASPFVYGYAMHWFDLSVEAGVALLTTWMWSVMYWGTVYHAKKVTEVFRRFDGTKN